MNFMEMPDDIRAEYTVIGCPWEETTAYRKGTKKAPFHVIHESTNIEPYDVELDVNPAEGGIRTLLCRGAPMKLWPSILKDVKEEISGFPVFIGGEHTITYSILTEAIDEIDGLAIFDAHADMYDTYLGKRMAHATWLRRLKERLPDLPVYIMGLRVASNEEKEALEDSNVKNAIPEGKKKLYVSIDVDVLDMSAMPCASNPEPAGMTWKELYSYLRSVFHNNRVVGADVVEYSPCKGQRQYSYAVAALVYKLMSFHNWSIRK